MTFIEQQQQRLSVHFVDVFFVQYDDILQGAGYI